LVSDYSLEIVLPTLTEAPVPLHELLHDQTPRAKQFQDLICNYNSDFDFMSFGAEILETARTFHLEALQWVGLIMVSVCAFLESHFLLRKMSFL